MTIAIGFCCKDGIVLCADEQISTVDYHKTFESKIRLAEGSTWNVGFTYAGDPGLFKETTEKIEEQLFEMEDTEVDASAVYRATDKVLTDLGRKYSALPLEMAVGFTARATTAQLFAFRGSGLYHVDSFICLGKGDSSVVHFLKEKLYSPVFSADYGESLGVYLIAKATKHIDHCGGLTDLLVMRNGEIPSLWIEEKETSERLARMEKIENSAFNQIRKEFEKDFVL